MSSRAIIQAIDEFETVVSRLVTERTDSADLQRYRFPKLQKTIENIRDLVILRSSIFVQLHTINDLSADEFNPADENGIITFYSIGSNIPFSHLRFSLMQNYMSTTWAIYDTISDLSGIDPLEPEGARSEVFQFDRYCFMNSGKVAKHSVFEKLRETYAPYIGLSYAIRNWVIHDGIFSVSANVRLFDSEMPVKGDRFTIPKESWREIRKRVEEKYKTPIEKPDIPKEDDVCILTMIALLEGHNDQLFAHLLGYTGKLLRLNGMQVSAI